MNKILRKIASEPAALLGLVTAASGLAILFGVPLSAEQAGGILAFVGALCGLLRFIVTPSAEVAAQRPDPEGPLVAGPASWVKDGDPVVVAPVDHPLDPDGFAA